MRREGQMRRVGRKLALLLAFTALGAFADAPVVYVNWRGGGATAPSFYAPYSDGEGNTVTFLNDGTEYLVVTNASWSQGLKFDWNLYGLCFDMTSRSYTDSTGKIIIGAGGFRFAKACRYAVAGWWVPDDMRLYLSASQTWEGPDSGSYASFSIGDENHNKNYPHYRKCVLGADPGVTDWTIRKRLNLWIIYTNRISHVDVRLESPARIYLPTAWNSESTTINELPKIGAKSLTLAGDGVMWRAGVKTTDPQPMTTTVPVGVLNPNLDSETLAPKLILEGGADIVVTNAVWNIPELIVTGEGATSEFTGTMAFQRESTSIELRDGARLKLPEVCSESDVSASLAVSGTGTVRIASATGWGLTGTLALGPDVDLELAGVETPSLTVTGGRALSLDPGIGEFRLIPASIYAAMAGKKIAIQSGTLYIGSMADLPAAATIEIAAGATLVFSSNAGYDASRITGAGAANVTFDSTIVTDTPVAAGELTVCTGELLRVIGSGLTAATSLKLAGGTLRFESSATVASPVLVTAGSFIEASGAIVVGTMSGAITSTCSAEPRSVAITVRFGYADTVSRNVTGIWVLGPGKVAFTGGGTFSGTRDELVVTRDASLDLTGGTYAFGGRGDKYSTSLVRIQSLKDNVSYGYGRKVCVKDGGNVTFAAPSGSSSNSCILVASSKDASNYNTTTKIATFEVGAGGSVTIPRNGLVYLGTVDSHVELKIAGGTFTMDADGATIFVGNGDSFTPGGDIILEGGTLSLGNPIFREWGGEAPSGNRSPRGRFLWSGGTLKLNSHFSAATIFDMVDKVKNYASEKINGYLRIITQISGDGCTLDLSEMNRDSVANVPAGLDQAEWYGTGTITVKGGKEFVMNSFPDSISFRTEGDGTKITVPPEAYVYDNATCLTYFDRSMYDLGNPYSTTNGALAAATVATYTSAGTNCTFAATRENLPLSVTNVLVTGEWNNAHSVSAAGGLTLGDIEFAEGSLLSVAWRSGATTSQAFDGAIKLPAHLSARLIRDGGIAPTGQAALVAAQGVVGDATWTARLCRVMTDATTVRVVPIGTMVSIR